MARARASFASIHAGLLLFAPIRSRSLTHDLPAAMGSCPSARSHRRSPDRSHGPVGERLGSPRATERARREQRRCRGTQLRSAPVRVSTGRSRCCSSRERRRSRPARRCSARSDDGSRVERRRMKGQRKATRRERSSTGRPPRRARGGRWGSRATQSRSVVAARCSGSAILRSVGALWCFDVAERGSRRAGGTARRSGLRVPRPKLRSRRAERTPTREDYRSHRAMQRS
jgi:hypothetical protein